MTISELIKALEEIKKEHGDIKVYSAEYNDNGYVEDLDDYHKCDVLESIYEKGEYYEHLGFGVKETLMIL